MESQYFRSGHAQLEYILTESKKKRKTPNKLKSRYGFSTTLCFECGLVMSSSSLPYIRLLVDFLTWPIGLSQFMRLRPMLSRSISVSPRQHGQGKYCFSRGDRIFFYMFYMNVCMYMVGPKMWVSTWDDRTLYSIRSHVFSYILRELIHENYIFKDHNNSTIYIYY